MPRDQTAVMIEALADVAQGKQAMAMRKRQIEESPYYQHSDPTRDDYEPSPEIRALMTANLRLEIEFKDPIATRRDLEMIAGHLIRAIAILNDHERRGGPYRQLADARSTLHNARIELNVRHGRRGRKS